uniref:B9 n=1 Tax=Human betaherpesvirus 6 TaxID=10368 RepID=A0A649Z398_9BETA|nr:hypothetical protein [Human betaherpesvirus 6]
MGISVPARAQSDLPKQRRQRLYGNKCPGPSAAQLPGADRQRLYEKKWPDRSAVRPLRGENKTPEKPLQTRGYACDQDLISDRQN